MPSTTPAWSSLSAQAIASGSTSIVVTKPTGVVTSGLYIAVCHSNAAPTTFTVPAGEGWQGPVGTGSTSVEVYWRLTTGSEAATYTFARSNTTGNGGVIIAYFTPGTFDVTTPIAACTTQSSAAVTTIVLPTLTATTNGSLLAQFVSSTALTTATPWTAPGTATSRQNGNASGTAIPYIYGDETVNSGATGTRTWTHANSAAMRGAMLALNPLVTASVTDSWDSIAI